MAKLYVGLSGYSYKEWQGEGLFYPPELKQAQYFEYYSSRYNTVELDGTWYQMPAEASVAKWNSICPEGFLFAPKIHRRVSHFARLKPECEDSLKFFVKRLRPMQEAGKLGPILVQLPPNLKRDDDRLGNFLAMLPPLDSPENVANAATLQHHNTPIRWAMEFRNESWHAPEIEEMLRQAGVAWVGQDTDDNDAQRRHTAGHVYLRLRKTDYTESLLKDWADYFKDRLAEGQDVFVFCKHEDAEAPWIWADRIIELAGRA